MPAKSVIIIDDDSAVRETLCLVIEFLGYTVYSAENGKEGLVRLAEIEPPILILLDLMMPIMNGWDFVEEAKKVSKLKNIPIYVISAFRDLKGLEKKVSGVLKKPVNMDTLKHVLEHVQSKDPIVPSAKIG